MTRKLKIIAPPIAVVIVAASLAVHRLPPDWSALELGLAGLLTAGLCLAAWLQGGRIVDFVADSWRAQPPGRRFLLLFLWLAGAGLLGSTIQAWQPLQRVELTLAAERGPVALHYGWIDGREIPANAWQADDAVWKPIQACWTADGRQTGVMTWQGLGGRELRLLFATGPAAGIARLQVNGQQQTVDLRAPRTGTLAWTWTPSLRQGFGWAGWDWLAAALLSLGILAAALGCVDAAGPIGHRGASRLWLRNFCLSAVGGALLAVGFNYFVDPLQFYRAAAVPFWSTDQRSQNPGLARSYSYDTVLLGTSSVENYLPAKLDREYGWRTVKLAISGSSLYEQRQILDVALRTGQVKRVVWALDFMAAGGPADRVEDYFSPYPRYLYDTNPVNDLLYLFNGTTTEDSAAAVLHRLSLRAWHTPQLQLLNNWQTKYIFGEEQLWQSYRRIRSGDFGQPRLEVLYRPGRYTLAQFRANVQQNILPVIAARPDVQFILFLPPYSIPFYHIYWRQDPQVIEDWLQLRLWLAEQLASLPNVALHDFQADERYVENYHRYKDFLHYDSDVANEILDRMIREETRWNAVDVGINNTRLREMIQQLEKK